MTRDEAKAIAAAVAAMIESCTATMSDAINSKTDKLVEALIKASPAMEVDE
jgi:hypothetical protein